MSQYCCGERKANNMSSSISKNAANKKFAVVIFDGSDEASVVPVRWLTHDHLQCYWPDVVGSSLQKLVVNPNSVPLKTWKLHNARVFGKYKTLKSARQAEKSLYTSAVESDSSETESSDITPSTEPRARTRSHRRHNLRVHSEERESGDEPDNPIYQPLVIPDVVLFQSETPGNSGGVQVQIEAAASTNEVPGSAPVFLQRDLQGEQILLQILSQNACVSPLEAKIYAYTQTTLKNSHEKFQELILKKLAEIQLAQERILVVVGQYNTVDLEDFDSIPIPCYSKEDIQALEEFLESKEEKGRLKAVNGILKRILTDNFAIIGSCSGRGNAELGFEHFGNVHQTVKRATRKQDFYQNATLEQINSIIAEWLRLAKDRSTGRLHKKKGE